VTLRSARSAENEYAQRVFESDRLPCRSDDLCQSFVHASGRSCDRTPYRCAFGDSNGHLRGPVEAIHAVAPLVHSPSVRGRKFGQTAPQRVQRLRRQQVVEFNGEFAAPQHCVPGSGEGVTREGAGIATPRCASIIIRVNQIHGWISFLAGSRDNPSAAVLTIGLQHQVPGRQEAGNSLISEFCVRVMRLQLTAASRWSPPNRYHSWTAAGNGAPSDPARQAVRPRPLPGLPTRRGLRQLPRSRPSRTRSHHTALRRCHRRG
jgi:hypothetical protein